MNLEEPRKIIIVGEASVGKTSILDRWLHDTFSDETAPTIGAGMSPVQIVVDGERRLFHVWDTAGTPQYRSVTPMYCRRASIAIIVFDLTNRETFTKIGSWVGFVRQNASPFFILVGNKVDRDEERQVQVEEAQDCAASIPAYYVETSALTKQGMPEFLKFVVESATSALASEDKYTTKPSQFVQIQNDDGGEKRCNC